MEMYEKVKSGRGLHILLLLILLATLIDGIDTSIVYIVLPDIAEQFGTDLSSGTWIIVAYLAGIVGLMLFFGRAADKGRMKTVFILGVTVFIISSLSCALSYDLYSLIVFRFVQGLGASMMIASTPVMVVRLLPMNRVGTGMAVITMTSGISIAIGPTLGGFLADALSWHWIFLINIPIGAVLILLALKSVPGCGDRTMGKLPDIRLTAYVFVTMVFLLVFLESFTITDVPMPLVVIPASIAAIGTVLTYARHRSLDREDQLVDLDIFRNRDFTIITISFFLTTMMAAGVLYLLPYYLQTGAGYSTYGSGLLMTFASVFMIAASFATGRWCDIRGCRTPAAISIALRILFSSAFVFLVPGWGLMPLIATLVTMGVSFGISGTSQATRMSHHASPEEQGHATAMINVANYMGAAVGVVVYVMAFMWYTPGYGGAAITDIPADMIVCGFHGASVLGVVLAVVALICTLRVGNIVPEKDVTRE